VAPATATLKPDIEEFLHVPLVSPHSRPPWKDRTFVPAPRRGEAGRRRGSAVRSAFQGRTRFRHRFHAAERHRDGSGVRRNTRRRGFRKSWRKRVVNATPLSSLPRERGTRFESEPTGPCRRVNLRVSTICFDRRYFLRLRIKRDHNLGQRQAPRQSRQTRTGLRRSGCRFLSEFADRSRAEGSFQGDRPARIASRNRCCFRAPRDGGDLRRLHALRWQKGKEPVR
jgi:hypothetical protein